MLVFLPPASLAIVLAPSTPVSPTVLLSCQTNDTEFPRGANTRAAQRPYTHPGQSKTHIKYNQSTRPTNTADLYRKNHTSSRIGEKLIIHTRICIMMGSARMFAFCRVFLPWLLKKIRFCNHNLQTC